MHGRQNLIHVSATSRNALHSLFFGDFAQKLAGGSSTSVARDVGPGIKVTLFLLVRRRLALIRGSARILCTNGVGTRTVKPLYKICELFQRSATCRGWSLIFPPDKAASFLRGYSGTSRKTPRFDDAVLICMSFVAILGFPEDCNVVDDVSGRTKR